MSALVAGFVALGAAAQAVTGIGFALICGPFLVTTLGAREGVRMTVFLSAIVNAMVLLPEWRATRVRYALALLIPAAASLPLFARLVRGADPDVLAVAAGSLAIAGAAALAVGVRSARLVGPVGAAGAGVVSAAMNVVAGIGGPAAAVYAVNAGWPPAVTRATLQTYFLALNIVTLLALGMPVVESGPFLGLAAGWVAGTLLAKRLPDGPVRTTTLALAAAGGVLAIARAI